MTNKVREFHEKFGLLINKSPTLLGEEDKQLRIELIQEEYKEVCEAMQTDNLINIAKELSDLVYVVLGTAISCGIPIDDVFRDVHVSNMSKLDENGNPIRRADGKILKSNLYKEPDLSWLLSE